MKNLRIALDVDWLSFLLGAALEIPRANKHNFNLWIFRLHFLGFVLKVWRLNDRRIARPAPTA